MEWLNLIKILGYKHILIWVLSKKPTKNNFEKDFFKLKKNAVFGKTTKNVRKQINVKFVKTERRRNYLTSKPNYHTTAFFNRNEKSSNTFE